MTELTRQQQNVIDRINAHADYILDEVDTQEENRGYAYITFTNAETHPLLKEDYQISVSPRGKVRWLSAYRMLSHELDVRRCMCSLANYDLRISNRRTLAFGYSLTRAAYRNAAARKEEV